MTPTSTGMRARACLATELRPTPNGQQRSCVSTLRSQSPLLPRITMTAGQRPWTAGTPDAARVCLAAGAAGPIGGDQLTFHVAVGAGSSLILSDVSTTLLLPGPHGDESHTRIRIDVAAGGTLTWLPEPLVSTNGSDHLSDVRVDLEEGARLLMREEILLGRHGENSGRIRLRTRVRLGAKPLYRQDLSIGTPSARSPAITGHHRAVGSVLVVDPAWNNAGPTTPELTGTGAVLPLAGPGVLITALAADNLELRGRLQDGLAELGDPWAPQAAAR